MFNCLLKARGWFLVVIEQSFGQVAACRPDICPSFSLIKPAQDLSRTRRRQSAMTSEKFRSVAFGMETISFSILNFHTYSLNPDSRDVIHSSRNSSDSLKRFTVSNTANVLYTYFASYSQRLLVSFHLLSTLRSVRDDFIVANLDRSQISKPLNYCVVYPWARPEYIIYLL